MNVKYASLISNTGCWGLGVLPAPQELAPRPFPMHLPRAVAAIGSAEDMDQQHTPQLSKPPTASLQVRYKLPLSLMCPGAYLD